MRTLVRLQYFSKNSHCDLGLGLRTLKLELGQDKTFVRFKIKDRSIYKGGRVMTKFF